MNRYIRGWHHARVLFTGFLHTDPSGGMLMKQFASSNTG
ncbi:hypothetical protein ASZ90_016145 [hydrocarbon metagenome]|uniref:Uncharacterized protein n=1 Tax=hydrocarbon metagenome TaxID=938273 RepID=A0A0W8F005_9ZZZZ